MRSGIGDRRFKHQKKDEHPREFVNKYADYIRDQAMLYRRQGRMIGALIGDLSGLRC